MLAGPLARERFGLAGHPSVMSHALLSMCLADLGQFPEAIESAQVALRIATPLDHPYSLAVGYQCLGVALLQRGDAHGAIAALERALAICEQWVALAQCRRPSSYSSDMSACSPARPTMRSRC